MKTHHRTGAKAPIKLTDLIYAAAIALLIAILIYG